MEYHPDNYLKWKDENGTIINRFARAFKDYDNKTVIPLTWFYNISDMNYMRQSKADIFTTYSEIHTETSYDMLYRNNLLSSGFVESIENKLLRINIINMTPGDQILEDKLIDYLEQCKI